MTYNAFISPPIFSLLLSKAATRNFEAKLVGKTTWRNTKTYQDTGDELTSTEWNIVIENVQFLDEPFYDALGNVHSEVEVGWTKFRRNSPPIISIREERVLRNLKNPFEKEPKVFLLMTSLINSNSSIHTTEWTCILEHETRLVIVPLTIANLSCTQASDYHQFPSLATPYIDTSNILKIQDDLISAQEAACSDLIQKLQDRIDALPFSNTNSHLLSDSEAPINEMQQLTHDEPPSETLSKE
jgi:hypothetical protein